MRRCQQCGTVLNEFTAIVISHVDNHKHITFSCPYHEDEYFTITYDLTEKEIESGEIQADTIIM